MKARVKSFLTDYRLPILSGFLIGTSYIPFPPWALLFCLVPLWLFFLQRPNWKSILIGGGITQFLLTAIGFHWVAYTATEFGGFPWPLAVMVLLLFCALGHLHFAVHGLLWLFLKRRLNLEADAALWLLPFCFFLVEEFWPFLFPWHLGYPLLWAQIPAYHLAEWIGFKGLSLTVVLLNLLALKAYRAWKSKRSFRPLMLLGGLAAGLTAAGALLGWSHSKAPTKSLNVLIVQANIGNLEKMHAGQGYWEFMESIFEVYAGATDRALADHPQADLIVWPETAYPEDLNVSHRPLNSRFFSRLDQWDTPLITGAYLRLGSPEKTYNSMVLSQPGDKDVSAYYSKTHLLAFGEYLPLSGHLPLLRTWLPFVADFGRGSGPATLAFDSLSLGPQICYEGLFPEFSAQLALQGAQVLVNATNDSWFGYPFEPYQHLYMTAARAVETRRPLVRSTNTGLSTVINASGHLQEIGPRDEKWYGIYEVPYPVSTEPTVHSRLAPHWRWVVLLIFTLAGVIAYVQNRKHGLGAHTQ